MAIAGLNVTELLELALILVAVGAVSQFFAGTYLFVVGGRFVISLL